MDSFFADTHPKKLRHPKCGPKSAQKSQTAKRRPKMSPITYVCTFLVGCG